MSLRGWWKQRSLREQRLLLLAAAMALVAGWIAGVVQPGIRRWHDLTATVAAQRVELARMQEAAAVIGELRAITVASAANGESPLLAAQQLVRELDLEPFVVEAQSQGDAAVQMSFHEVPYESLLHWINGLPQRGLRVRVLSFSPSAEQGRCQVQITLEQTTS